MSIWRVLLQRVGGRVMGVVVAHVDGVLVVFLQAPPHYATPAPSLFGWHQTFSPSLLNTCRHPHIRFEVLDGNDVAGAEALLKEASGGKHTAFTRLFVDISGQVRPGKFQHQEVLGS